VTQHFTGDSISKTEPTFSFHACPVDRATTARLGQHYLPVKQGDHVPGRDGANYKGGTGPGDQGRARFGAAEWVVMVQKVGGDGLGGCDGCVDGGVVAVRDGFRVDLVANHTSGVLAGLSGRIIVSF